MASGTQNSEINCVCRMNNLRNMLESLETVVVYHLLVRGQGPVSLLEWGRAGVIFFQVNFFLCPPPVQKKL